MRIFDSLIDYIHIWLYWYRCVRPRKRFAKEDLKEKEPNIAATLTADEFSKLQPLWGKYLKRFPDQIRWFELYKTIWPNCDLKLFIPDDFYYCFVDEFFAKRSDCKIIDDKNLYNLLLFDVPQPKTVARCINGELMSADYHNITKDRFIALCKEAKHVIIKQSVDSEGGKGISFYKHTDDDAVFFDILKKKDFIVQEVISQHPELAKLHPESINTVRIISLFYDGKVIVLSVVVRMGVGESMVDNASSGGIVCGVNPDGTLKGKAYDVKANCYENHPSGVLFQSVKIPNIEECISQCVKLTPRFVSFTRLISWDFAIDTGGHPVLIEANLSFGEIDFHQMCNGPLLGSMSERIINYIYQNNPQAKFKA